MLFTDDYANCTVLFQIGDTNEDGYVSFSEALFVMTSHLGISKEKWAQIDCSECLSDPSLY